MGSSGSKEDADFASIDVQTGPATNPSMPSTPTSNSSESMLTLLKLPEEIQYMIFEEVIVKTEPLKPYYCYGSLKKGPWSSGYSDNLITTENINIDLFLVCKSISTLAIPIFYGRNIFCFSEAAVAQDFLSRFLHRIRRLEIIMSSGFLYTSNSRPHTMEQPQERQWRSLFHSLRHQQHSLQSLTITISGWKPLIGTKIPRSEQDYVQLQRMECIRALTKLTVPHTAIYEIGSRFMNRRDRDSLALLIQQKKGGAGNLLVQDSPDWRRKS